VLVFGISVVTLYFIKCIGRFCGSIDIIVLVIICFDMSVHYWWCNFVVLYSYTG
jgi:hypothetical protein